MSNQTRKKLKQLSEEQLLQKGKEANTLLWTFLILCAGYLIFVLVKWMFDEWDETILRSSPIFFALLSIALSFRAKKKMIEKEVQSRNS